MEKDDPKPPNTGENPRARNAGKALTPEARRALEEAAERRRQADEANRKQAAHKEVNGRGGLDPVRYGDWEVKGLTSDF